MNATSQTTKNITGSSTDNNNTASQTNPWSVQQPYLSTAFSGANTAMNNTSGMTPAQLAMFTSELGYGTNNLPIAASSANAGSTASAAGAAGTVAGINGLQGFNPASTNNMPNVINGANQFVAGENIPQQVQADMLGATQEAQQVTNPGIDATAAGSGNINSSRDAIEHGLVASNLAEQAGTLGANLQANAYTTGANTAESAAAANNSNTLASLLGLTTGGGYDTNAGTAANANSVSDASGLYGLSNTGAAGQNNDPFQALQDYYNIVGNKNWGSTGTTSSSGSTTNNSSEVGTSTPSTLSQIGGWINSIGSLL